MTNKFATLPRSSARGRDEWSLPEPRFWPTSGLPTNRPEPRLYASQDPFAQVSYLVVTLFSEGRWDAFSKTPTASHSVICFRVELHRGAEPTRPSGADSRTAKDLSSPCGDRCPRRGRWRNGKGKSDGIRRLLLSSQ